MNLERTFPDGTKRTLKDGPVVGGYFAVGGKRADLPLLIGEGLYTVYSASLATGFSGLVARNKANLRPVALMARGKYPEREIIVMADYDGATEGNPGVKSATEAAATIGAKLAIPPAGVGQKVDFDDLRRTEGLEAVRAIIEAARPVEPEPATEAGGAYPEPMPLPDGLPPVAAFEMALLPETLRPWAADIVGADAMPAGLRGRDNHGGPGRYHRPAGGHPAASVNRLDRHRQSMGAADRPARRAQVSGDGSGPCPCQASGGLGR
jgi:putative DNA primase/helicase